MYVGPANVLLVMDVEFRHSASAGEIAEAIRTIKSEIRDLFPGMKRIYIEGEVRSAVKPRL